MNTVDSFVILRDPNLNEFEVHVTKKSNKLYFDKGIITRWGVEVKYPTHSPPLKRLLDRTDLDNPSSSRVLRPSLNVYVPYRSFVRTLMKQVTKHDIHSGVLTLPWSDFGSNCIDVEGQYTCEVSGGWVDLCTVYGVDEGTRVGFCVDQPVCDHVMYVTAYPQMGIQTTPSYPLSDGSQVPLYVSRHYFLA
ncbi:hypothetical protein TSUD_287210 [Trifolium subterraneum]|uniref:Uncharacterized protein n=1 Tax=Trifolium subterraneum TaxID=3900 RepID=A0A2Z6PJ71_TRISU|nr:hypothetical protein TSUD_287210 [Trifolium subterraneum]